MGCQAAGLMVAPLWPQRVPGTGSAVPPQSPSSPATSHPIAPLLLQTLTPAAGTPRKRCCSANPHWRQPPDAGSPSPGGQRRAPAVPCHAHEERCLSPGSVPPPAPPALPKLPSRCRVPRRVLPLICALLPPRAAAQLPLPPRKGAVAAPGVPPHGTAPRQRRGSATTLGCRGVPVPPTVPPSPALSSPRPSQQHRNAVTVTPEIFEGSAEEEEFLQIKVVEGSWSPGGAARGSPGWAPGQGVLGDVGLAGRDWDGARGVSHSAPPLLRTDDGEGAATMGAPGPADGPCSAGERWAQGARAARCSRSSRPAAHRSLPLQMHNGSGCVCPVRPGPPGPPGPKVRWCPPERGTGTRWEKSHSSFGRAKPFLCRLWTLAGGSGLRGGSGVPWQGGAAGPCGGHRQRNVPGAGSQALSSPAGRERRPRVPGGEGPARILWGEREVRQPGAARSPGSPGPSGSSRTSRAPRTTRRLGGQEPTRARRPPQGIGE